MKDKYAVFCLQAEYSEYSPAVYTSPKVLEKPVWADPDIMKL